MRLMTTQDSFNTLAALLNLQMSYQAFGAAPPETNSTISDIQDWTPVVETALNHGVLALLAQLPQLCEPDVFPDDIKQALDVFTARQRQANHGRFTELVKVIRHFEDSGIATMAFKGPWLSQVVYGDLGMRTFWDLDVLVHRSDWEQAITLLRSEGFQCRDDLPPSLLRKYWAVNGQEVFWHNDSNEVVVELHWAFVPTLFSINLDYDALFSRSQISRIEGDPIRHLEPEDELHYQCLHASKEAFYQLRWSADLAFYILSHPQLDWDIIWQRARETNTLRITALALEVMQRLFPAMRKHITTQQIAPPDQPTLALADDIVRHLGDKESTEIPGMAFSNYRMRIREGFGDKLRYAWRTLVTPRPAHYLMLRLPRYLYPGYCLVKVLHDGFALPLYKRWRSLFGNA